MSSPGVRHEHEFEAALGLPEPLPAGERLLWQGAPDAWTMAVSAFHLRKLAVYFAALLLVRGLFVGTEAGAGAGVLAALWLAPVFLLALGLMLLMARLSARAAMYTLTDRRVIMRVGIVLTVTFNLPLTRIESAAVHRSAHGHGDLALTLPLGDKIAYLHLWPHARPWRAARPEPMLRCIANVAQVAALVADAWTKANAPVAAPALRTEGSSQSSAPMSAMAAMAPMAPMAASLSSPNTVVSAHLAMSPGSAHHSPSLASPS